MAETETLEQRVAELESQLAALTATTPTEYYTHQYSGEEIDAAVGRAVSGGALDTSVENVSKELGTFVRPNLLDNWYFGRPVDQRGGYVAIPGASYYVSGNAEGTPAGTLSAYASVSKYNEEWYNYILNSTTYWIPAGYVVRGYTGKGYGVDRWTSLSGTITMGVRDDGLMVSTTVTSGATEVCQYFESYIKAGTMLTLSAIVSKSETSQNGILRVKYTNNEAGVQMSLPVRAMDHELVSITQESKLDVVSCVMRISNGDGYTVHAIKLELGDTQTLAHQDSAGNWVLNEVPDYGEQLRRCQRYFRRYMGAVNKPIGVAIRRESSLLELVIPLEPAMRVAPAITYSGNFVAIPSFTWCNITGVDMSTPGSVSLFLSPQNTSTTFSADAYQINLAYAADYIDLSADL